MGVRWFPPCRTPLRGCGHPLEAGRELGLVWVRMDWEAFQVLDSHRDFHFKAVKEI
jgi:hypothetical protein